MTAHAKHSMLQRVKIGSCNSPLFSVILLVSFSLFLNEVCINQYYLVQLLTLVSQFPCVSSKVSEHHELFGTSLRSRVSFFFFFSNEGGALADGDDTGP